jgi:hypothetical protein
MSFSNLSRRSLILSIFAVAACQTTGTSISTAKVLTNKYDGKYELYVGRFGRDTALYRRTGNAGREEELARLTLSSEGGKLRLVSLRDYTNAGPNFSDFEGAFYDGDAVSMKFTTSFLFNQRKTYTINFETAVSDSLNGGQWLQIEPEGWDDNNDAIIRLRRVG